MLNLSPDELRDLISYLDDSSTTISLNRLQLIRDKLVKALKEVSKKDS